MVKQQKKADLGPKRCPSLFWPVFHATQLPEVSVNVVVSLHFLHPVNVVDY